MSVTGRAGGALQQWPVGHKLTWTVVRTVPGFSDMDLKDIYTDAWESWDRVCGLTIDYVSRASQANIWAGSRPIDGPRGILAEAQLPWAGIPPNAQLHAWADDGDRWVRSDNPPAGMHDILRTMKHEFGHNIGIGHNQDGIINALMDPAYSHIIDQQDWDIREAVARYGSESIPGDEDRPKGNDLANLLRLLLECADRLSQEQADAILGLLGNGGSTDTD